MNLKCIHGLFLASALLILSACDEPEPEPPAITTVSTQALSELLVPHHYRASAQALSLRSSDIAAEINAIITHIIEDVGDSVAVGEPLIQLDCREVEAVKIQSEATLAALNAREALAKQQLKRTQKLRRTKSTSEEELNQKQSTLDAANAEKRAQIASLEIANLNVERCSATAPFAGVITERFAQEGERITQGTRLLHLVDHENLQIHAQIAADASDNLTKNSKINFVSNNQTYPAELVSLAAVIDSRTQTQAARFNFTNEKPKAGTLGHITWSDERLALPIKLVLERNKQQGLFYTENKIARFYPLTQVEAGQPIYVDLPADTQIITKGHLGLTIDEPIEITNKK